MSRRAPSIFRLYDRISFVNPVFNIVAVNKCNGTTKATNKSFGRKPNTAYDT